MKNLKYLIIIALFVSACGSTNKEEEIKDNDNIILIDSSETINENETTDKTVKFKVFEELNLPFVINSINIGERIDDYDLKKEMFFQHVPKDDDDLHFQIIENSFHSVGLFYETKDYFAIIYLIESSKYFEFYLATYDNNDKIIANEIIGGFALIFPYETETYITLNSDYSINSITTQRNLEENIILYEETMKYTIQQDGKISMIDLEDELKPIYEEFDDASPKTSSNDYIDFIEQYNEITKGEGYTQENPDIERHYTEVTLKKKDGIIKMIEIYESASRYDNLFQYFYKNDELFYVYISLENASEEDDSRNIEKRKFYFAEGKCILWLFNSSDGNKEYPIYASTANEILQQGNEYLQRTKDNKWNEF